MINLVMAIVAVTGVALNAKGKWQGFIFGMISSVWWCGYNIWLGEYIQAFLFGVFCVLSFYGIFKWQYDRKKLIERHEREILTTQKRENIRLTELLDENARMGAFIAGLPYHKKAKKRLRINVPTTSGKKG